MQCTDPDHRHGGEDMIKRVESACLERGLRFTDLRRRVFELVAESPRPVKAYDLLGKLHNHSSAAAAPPTVYRALDFLMDNGFVHKLETMNAYVPCPHPESGQHGSQFLVCDECHETLELDANGVVDQLKRQSESQGFEPRRLTVEVYGLCARCRQSH